MIGELISAGGPMVIDKVKGKPSGDLERKIRSYSSRPFENIWTNANDDLVALIAISELMYERRIVPLSRMDEERMQIHFGVNAFSALATNQAVTAMREEKQRMSQLPDQCDALIALGKTLVAKSFFFEFFSSQPHFDEMARQELNKRCDTNKEAIDRILKVLNTILPLNERILQEHRQRRTFQH
ncbi:MAG: hypothetical protein R2815_11575 [Flavobacteriales bacterium]